ncbi:TolC family protein [Tuwongella immobilis]|uniref:Uncharacterized protein n=1 Tax=Tuwongella immobilis TaxID=692036 RepID=A0A6C2YNI4_9BACT|nr:TolC family protein [Tuwongella immobilis]VIP02996.1 membrane protein : Outer membrane efflux protein OS=Planctomyces limnophilus (strain ATCC 43296 / DSM 3776 / IFAM 1008 / 290) GN=Plim_2850 PE=4 SV=1: OEP: OEP [Tuwongella immobilis]VTS03076.1 membrane protein : Outer membrane efflux protein OS=Planctomyces limnophilus (strain ATCC 43296 / DSM 3776 / IFAM 1008 / 290) GN=Plim_2850 PE=4 SV=1: OEP: OEP [Tuwongella immobilis]
MATQLNRFSSDRLRWLSLRLAFCGIVVATPACHLPSLRGPLPGPAIPETVTQSAIPAGSPTENSANFSVDEFFHDSRLSSLIHEGLANNQELRIVQEEIQVARNEIMSRQGAYLPFLTGGASAGIEKPSEFTRNGAVEDQLEILPGRSFPNPLPNYGAGLNFFWQLDIWRQLRNAKDAAFFRYLASIDRRNYLVTKLVAEIAENYYTLMALDQRMITLNETIRLQSKSLEISKAKKDAGRGTELAVQRFEAEVKKNLSEKLVVEQEIIQTENRINFLAGRYPQHIDRDASNFFDLTLRPLSVGVPSDLLRNRPDIRQAERELYAAGLDVKVARARFFPTLAITAGVGYEAFNPRYIVRPEAIAFNVAGGLIAPILNKKEIRADYLSANAKQLQAIYHYQQLVLNAYVEVVNRVSKAENYRKSLDNKKLQLSALTTSVDVASKLFDNARAEYVEVLLAQRDLMDARMEFIELKREQLAAMTNAYQALGGGNMFQNMAPAPPRIMDKE